MNDTQEKEIALFKKFVDSGYDQAKFTKALYRALTFSFGFIAHYDINGFYVARFAGWTERVDTFAQILEWPHRNRDPFEQSVRDYVREERLLDRAKRAAAEELETSERAELARLKEKYEP